MKTSYLVSLLLLPLFSQAGVMNGGGGKGVLCATSANSQVLEVLDLYEAKNIFKLEEESRKASLSEEWAMAAERMNTVFQEPNKPVQTPPPIDQASLEKQMRELMIPIPAGARLPLTDDATLPVLPSACKIVQIAVYNNLGLQLDEEYWNLLDSRNKAALFLHEMLYLSRRDYGATDSDQTRRFVGRVFSKTPPPTRLVANGKGFFNCQAGGVAGAPIFDFIIAPQVYEDITSDTPWIVSFRQFAGVTTLSRITADIGRFSTNAVEFNMNRELHADQYRETRTLNLSLKNAGSNRAVVSVSFYDSKTGVTSATAHGGCDWVKR